MSFWFFLWLILSVISLGFLGWLLVILFRQKQSWKQFAQKYGLRFNSNKIMEAPDMDGVIEDYATNFFASEHFPLNTRSSRKMTAIEVTLNSHPPVDFCLACGLMVDVAKTFGIKVEVKPPYKDWKEGFIALTENKNVFNAYLNEERVKIITRLMGVKNAHILLICRKDTMLLRMDISDPLLSVQKLEKVKAMLIKTAQTFELSEGEGKRLKIEETRTAAKDISLDIDDNIFENAPLGLALEEDEEREEHVEVETPEEVNEAPSSGDKKPS